MKLKVLTAADLGHALDVRTYEDRARVRGVIQALRKSGEIRTRNKHFGRVVYEYISRPKKRTKLDIIWHLIRSHRRFDADEIERLSGAARHTVLEYLRCLKDFEYLRKKGRSRWELILDPGPETPVNTAKCQRLRRLRKNGSG